MFAREIFGHESASSSSTPMMLIDERVGSKELVLPLIRAGVPAEAASLEFGDFAFVGRGIDDTPVTIGIELKRLVRRESGQTDLIESLKSDRFAGHQLPGLQGYDRAWLVTEGLWREGDAGHVELYDRGAWSPLMQGRNFVMMGDLLSRLMTLIIRGGFHYWHCNNRRELVMFLAVIYHWWTSKALDEHRSHQAIYTPLPDRVPMIEPSIFRKMICQLPGIGWDKSIAVEDHFKTPYAMIAATPAEWLQIPGIGKTLALKAVHTLRNAT